VSAVEGAPVNRLQDLRLGHPSFIGTPGHGLALWRYGAYCCPHRLPWFIFYL
jgi:hypothetical protein